MTSIQGLGSHFRNIGLTALVAIGAVAAIGLASPARAASDYLLEIDGVKGEAAALEQQLAEKSKQATELIDSISADFQALQALGVDIASLGDQLLAVRKQGGDQQEYYVAQLQDAQKVFEDQIASLLDESVASQVRSDIEARLTKAIKDGDAKLEEQLSESDLSSIQEGIDLLGEGVRGVTKISAITMRFAKIVGTNSSDQKY